MKQILLGFGCLLATSSFAQDGTLDASFGNSGIITHNLAPGVNDEFKASVIAPDGKIICSGYQGEVGIADFLIARMNSDGSLDDTFSGDGLLTVDFEGGNDASWAVDVQADGKIVAVGFALSAGLTQAAAVRVNTDGTLDNTFGTGGKIAVLGPGIGTRGWAVKIQDDGKIVIAGTSQTSSYDFD